MLKGFNTDFSQCWLELMSAGASKTNTLSDAESKMENRTGEAGMCGLGQWR